MRNDLGAVVYDDHSSFIFMIADAYAYTDIEGKEQNFPVRPLRHSIIDYKVHKTFFSFRPAIRNRLVYGSAPLAITLDSCLKC